MKGFWYRSQAIAAGILAAYEIVAVIWFTDPQRFEFPLANVLGFFAVVAYIPGVILSLIINQEMLVRRGNPVVSKRERVLLAVQFAVVALSLVMLGIQFLFIENLVVWLAVIVLAIVNLVALSRRKN